MERVSEQRVRLPRDENPERRVSTRFPLTLEVRYAVLGHGGPAETGTGRTIDLSSSGLSFTAERPLETGQRIDVSIDWPVLLGGGVQLQLIMSGQVVRSNGSATALQIERHEFRTRRGRQKAEPPRESFD
jgi:PilZ domain